MCFMPAWKGMALSLRGQKVFNLNITVWEERAYEIKTYKAGKGVDPV